MHSDSKREKALSAALQLAETFCKGATGCGVVGVESAAGLLLALIQQLKTVKENVDTCKGLIAELSSLATLLDNLLDEIGRPKTENERVTVARLGSEEEFKVRVDGLLAALRSVEEDARSLVDVTSDKGVKASIKRFFTASPNKDRLNSMADALQKATKDFHFRGSIAVELLSRELLKKLAVEVEEAKAARVAQELRDEEARVAQEQRDEEARRIREADEARREVERLEARLAQQRRDEDALRVREADEARREAERQEQEWKTLLEPLSRAKVDAEYSSSSNNASPPLQGTRVALLKDIDKWATDDSEGQLPFYVLTGGAGTGKSTIAYAVAQRAQQRRVRGEMGQLAASFFFTRGAEGLDSADTVFTTLAYQMLATMSGLKPGARIVLEDYNRLGDRPKLEIQADYLFVRLLSQLPPDHLPIVIIIDAVDECADMSRAKLILKLMMDGLAKISSAVRIFVTSRPEVHIEHALWSLPFVAPLNSPDFVNRLQRLRLHEIPQDVVDSDIKLYLKTELRELQADSLFGELSAAEELTRMAAGLFIYATTMVQYLRSCAEDGSVPDMALRQHKAPKPALNKLGDLYAIILDRARIGASDPDRSLAAMKVVLGYIAVLQDHLSPNALIALSPLDLKDHIFPALRRLAPVLSFNPEKGDLPVRPLHASFVDYLLDGNCSRAEYGVSAPEQHLRLATFTLMLLKNTKTVTHYLDHLNQSRRSQSLVSNAHSHPSEVVPDAMRYACVYWPTHVTRLDPNPLLMLVDERAPADVPEPLNGNIHDWREVCSTFFLPEHILRWIEVLGYLKRLGTATDWLPSLCRVFANLDKTVADILHDAYRLVVVFYPVLVKDPRQLYISALPQCPDTSLLRACIPEAVAIPRSLLPYPVWSPSGTHVTEQLSSKAFGAGRYGWLIRPSPDGQWVAASLRSGVRGDIHLRDATTGILLRTLRVHASHLVDFGISSDSRFIVSATRDGEICITDSSSGIPVTRYYHTDGDVTRVAFRCNDSELLLVHTHRGHGLDRPVHFLILDWERTEEELRPRWESHGLRDEDRNRSIRTPWSISPDGRWGVFWPTGALLDLRSFAEVKLSFIPDTAAISVMSPQTCGTWLSPSLLVCSVLHKDGCSLSVVDIGQDIKEVETRAIRSVPTRCIFYAMEASTEGSWVVLRGDSKSSGNCIFLWDPTGDEIRLVKYAYVRDFCLSPRGDALYLAVDSIWSVIPTSQLLATTAQPLHSTSLKFSATRDTIMVATQLPVESSDSEVDASSPRFKFGPADGSDWEVGILSRGFSSSSGTAGVVSRHNFGLRPFIGTAALTPDPHSMIFPDDDVVLHSMGDISKTFSVPSGRSEHARYPTHWRYASMSPNLSRSCVVACGSSPDLRNSGKELIFAVWDTASSSLLHAFRTPWPALPGWEHAVGLAKKPREEIIVTDALDIHYLLDHHSFAYPHSDWSASDLESLLMPRPGPVPGEWFRIGNDGWVTRSDEHPEVGRRGREKLFWIPPSQRVDQLWRGDQHLLAMVTEYDVIVLDLSEFDDDTKEQHVPRLQIENE